MRIRLLYIHRALTHEDFQLTNTDLIRRLSQTTIMIFEGRQFNSVGFKDGLYWYREHPYLDSVIINREDFDS